MLLNNGNKTQRVSVLKRTAIGDVVYQLRQESD